MDKLNGSSSILPALLLLVVSAGVSVGLAAAPPTDGKPVAVVFAPSMDARGAFLAAAEAGALIVRPGGLPNIIVVQSDEPTLFEHLHRVGAWLIVHPRALAVCL